MLLSACETDLAPDRFLRAACSIFATFDQETQDSGNVAYGVETPGERFFVKTAGALDDTRAPLPYEERVELLRNAIRFARKFSHPALVPLRNVVESPGGPLLVYDWVEGELLRRAPDPPPGPASTLQRFRELPLSKRLAALDRLFDLHREVASEGWVAVDLYDGSLIYDFTRHSLRVIDLDHYRDAPFTNEMGRMFGSSRFMSPEEFELGARIDQRSNVFTMGRAARSFLLQDAGSGRPVRELTGLFEVAQRACRPRPQDRYPSLAAFHAAWREARDGDPQPRGRRA